jgi:hypothetical protein
MYINGTLDKQMSGDSGSDRGAKIFKIGLNGIVSTPLNGMMNEVSVWNKTLTLAEVQELFNDGVALDARTHSLSPSTGTDYLIGYWRNEGLGEWEDLSQNTNDGTPAGSPDTILLPEGTTAGKDILGFPLTSPNSGWLNLSGGDGVTGEYLFMNHKFNYTNFTIEGWVNPDTNGANKHIFDGRDSASDGVVVTITDAEKFFWRIADGSDSDQTSDSAYTGEWFYFACTYDGVTQKMYVGTSTVAPILADASITVSKQVSLTGTNGTFIGQSFTRTDQNFVGQLDEIRFYDRALTAFESDGSVPETGETITSGQILKNWKHGKSKHSN